MRQRGIRIEAWLDAGAIDLPAAEAHGVRVAIETDPLEVLKMGDYFDTCLGLDAFNAFSALANACDVNKRVLYGRGKSGEVVARCLLALTGEGHIVCFRPYCHRSEIPWRAIVAEVAGGLARAMGAEVRGEGRVPRLLAPDWYDDGIYSLAGEAEFLLPESPFRKDLPGLASAAFLPRVRDEIRKDAIPAPVALRLLGVLRECERPDLAEILLPFVEPSKLGYDTSAWLASSIFPSRPERAVEIVLRASRGDYPVEAAARLREFGRADLCLGILRPLAHRRAPAWERPWVWLEMGRALMALRRFRRARACLERAIRHARGGPAGDDARKLLAEIRGPAGL